MDVYFVRNYTIQEYLTRQRINQIFHKHFWEYNLSPASGKVFAFQIRMFNIRSINQLGVILPNEEMPAFLNNIIFCEDFLRFDKGSFELFIINALENSPVNYNSIIFTRLLK